MGKERLAEADAHDHYTIVIPARQWPGELISMNAMRGKSKILAHKTAPWRDLGKLLGGQALRNGTIGLLPDGIRIWAEIRRKDNRRRDAANVMPSIKALLDGITDTGIIRDDSDGTIEGPWPRRIYPNGAEELRLIFEVVGVPALGTQLYE